jgi:acyl carrier protein
MQMDRDRVTHVVLAQAAEISGMPASAIGEHTRIDDLALDSLSTIELTVAIEDALQTQIDCGQRVSAETLGCFVSMVMARGAGTMRLPMAA